MSKTLSPVFILRRNPYRDTSLLLDLFTRDAGKITCVARSSRGKRGRSKGMLEPFRQLESSWTGKGEVFTLFHAEESQRFSLKGGSLVRAVYLNELLLRVLWKQQAQPELFAGYQNVLAQLQQAADTIALPLFELDVLATAGYVLNLWHDDATGQAIDLQRRYRFRADHGLYPDEGEGKGVPVSGKLLIALREPQEMQEEQRLEFRYTLDYLIQMFLKGKTLNARKLFHE